MSIIVILNILWLRLEANFADIVCQKPNISQSRYIDILLTSPKLMICSKIYPKLVGVPGECILPIYVIRQSSKSMMI